MLYSDGDIEDTQILVMNMTFISSSDMKKIYISCVAKPRKKYIFFHFMR